MTPCARAIGCSPPATAASCRADCRSGSAVKGYDGLWRVALDSDTAPIDFVQILLFKDFSQLASPGALAPRTLPSNATEAPAALAPPPTKAPPATASPANTVTKP